MKKNSSVNALRFFLFFLLCTSGIPFVQPVHSQIFVGSREVPPIDYANPKEYEIQISFSGNEFADKELLGNASGLKNGMKIKIPSDEISKAIQNLWKLGLFADIKVVATKVQGNSIYLEFRVQERPRLSQFSFKGIGRGDIDKLREELNIDRGTVVTENLTKTTENRVRNYFIDKGFLDADVKIETPRDTNTLNAVRMVIVVDKKQKIKIDEIIVQGNDELSSGKIKRAMKDTKEKTKVTLFRPVRNKFVSWDSLRTIDLLKFAATFTPGNFADYLKEHVRLRIFSTSRYLEENFVTDKQKIIEKYNARGFRDAKVVRDSLYRKDDKSLKLEVFMDEGHKYYFGTISWLGNTKYTSGFLNEILGIKKGEVFDQSLLDLRLFMNPNGRDVSSLYLDDGYLFFSVTPVEVAVNNDTIDLEMRIYEGKQATISRVTVNGNTKTNDRVIMREIRTRPGQLFSRSDIIRTQREVLALGLFDPEKLQVNPKPNPAEGTVDIEYTVEEKASDQVELSGGYGAGQLVGTLGVSFNNFSTRNMFQKGAWRPLPAGDGQRLTLRAQSNGVYFQSYNASFTEPWLGGKKPNSLSVSVYHSVQTNGLKRNAPNRESIKITGTSFGFGKRLKWPDDYFTSYSEISLQHYLLNNFSSTFLFSDGRSNNFSFRQTFARTSLAYHPFYPVTGSELSFTVQATPPYSLFQNKDYSLISDEEKYKFIEYHKWKFKSSWFLKLTGGKASDMDQSKGALVLHMRMQYGFLGMYNRAIGHAPFERFYLGGDGLSGFSLDGREIIALRGYDNSSLTPRGKQGIIGGTIFDKYTFELRYPLSLNPQATIFVLGFAEAGNAWLKFKEFNPFEVKRSAGVGLRIFLPMFGLLGLDWGYGFDRPGGEKSGQFHFSIGGSID